MKTNRRKKGFINKNDPLYNSFYCFNYKRKKRGLNEYTFEEFKKYKQDGYINKERPTSKNFYYYGAYI